MDYLIVYFSYARLELCDQTEVNRREQRGREIGSLIEVGGEKWWEGEVWLVH